MELRDYLILVVFAVLIVAGGAVASAESLGQFLQSGAEETVRTAIEMAWITWWALVLGFAIAGGVEAWLSEDDISQYLDGAGPRELGTGAFFGFVSSSCSYSAIATSKNLFKKGASAAASLGAFMFASTNLVIEIGFVIWILLGWQFVVADFLGGFVLIGLMAVGFTYFVPDEVIESAREHASEEDTTVRDPNCGMEVDPDETDYTREYEGTTYYFCSASCMNGWNPEEANTTVWEQATSLSGWRALADKQLKEWGMLWDEIAIGFLFAGLIAGFVPDSVWQAVFAGPVFSSYTYVVWTAVLGAVIGIATFVCSVGNVPFGAILFTRGLPFGSVLSYIYADLVIPPIMQAYREYYGTTFAAVLSAMIFVAAVVTGVLVHALFGAFGAIPDPSVATVDEISIKLNYKAALNVLATVAFLGLYYLHKSGASDTGHDHGDHDHSGQSHGHD